MKKLILFLTFYLIVITAFGQAKLVADSTGGNNLQASPSIQWSRSLLYGKQLYYIYDTKTGKTLPIYTAQLANYIFLGKDEAANLYQAKGSYLTTENDPTVPNYSKSLTSFSVIKPSTDALYLGLHSSAENSLLLGNQNAAYYLNRGNQTGSQSQSTITGLPDSLSNKYSKSDAIVRFQAKGNYLTTEADPTVPNYAKSLTSFSAIKSNTDPLYLQGITGDISVPSGGGFQGATLPTLNPNPGTAGNASSSLTIVTDGKGRVTGVTSQPIQITASQVSGLSNGSITAVNGTTNQINSSTTNGIITLSTPQDISTNSNVTFNQVTASSFIGNATSAINATNANNTTLWNGLPYYGGGLASSVAYALIYDNANSRAGLASANQLQSFLSLGSLAYLNNGATLSSSITGNAATATNSAQWNTLVFDNSIGARGDGVVSILGTYTNGVVNRFTGSAVGAAIGLGSAAYTNSASYVPYINATNDLNMPNSIGIQRALFLKGGNGNIKLSSDSIYTNTVKVIGGLHTTNNITTDGSINGSALNFTLSSGLTSTILKTNSTGSVLPAAAGTDYIVPAALNSYIPYNGATGPVNLGSNYLIAANISSYGQMTVNNAPLVLLGAGNALIYYDVNNSAIQSRKSYVADGIYYVTSPSYSNILVHTLNMSTGQSYFRGSMGIGQINPSYSLDVVGNIRATGDVIANSDIRLKKNVKPILNATELLGKLNGYYFDWKKTDKHSVGVIAQEVEKVFPELVTKDNEGILSVDYMKLTAPLIQAFNEQSKRISELEKQIKTLKKN